MKKILLFSLLSSISMANPIVARQAVIQAAKAGLKELAQAVGSDALSNYLSNNHIQLKGGVGYESNVNKTSTDKESSQVNYYSISGGMHQADFNFYVNYNSKSIINHSNKDISSLNMLVDFNGLISMIIPPLIDTVVFSHIKYEDLYELEKLGIGKTIDGGPAKIGFYISSNHYLYTPYVDDLDTTDYYEFSINTAFGESDSKLDISFIKTYKIKSDSNAKEEYDRITLNLNTEYSISLLSFALPFFPSKWGNFKISYTYTHYNDIDKFYNKTETSYDILAENSLSRIEFGGTGIDWKVMYQKHYSNISDYSYTNYGTSINLSLSF